MPLHLIRADLTRFRCDAVVISVDESLHGGSMLGACSSAAGPSFADELHLLESLPPGSVQHLRGEHFQCRYTILTTAPTWQDGHSGEPEQLTACYQNSLKRARELGCKKVAVGLINSRAYGIPQDIALDTAIDAITAYLEQHDLEVYLTVFDLHSYADYAEQDRRLRDFLDKCLEKNRFKSGRKFFAVGGMAEMQERSFGVGILPAAGVAAKQPDLASQLQMLDESFSEMLLRKIDESGMTDAECYKRANIDRRCFSKIRSDKHYHPKKSTAVAFAIALELDLDETQELLRKAGYSLSRSNKFDIIIEFFIREGNYNVFDINEALYQYDQKLLGLD